MKVSEFLRALDQIIPLAAVGYAKDAVGLQVGYENNAEVKKILLAYEVTEEIIDEAVSRDANLIVSYHPLIFPNISSITDSSRTGALLRRLIKNDIALYVLHTAFDSHPDFGTSKLMADALSLENIKPLVSPTDLLQKIVVFVPQNTLSEVQQAMWQAGAGNIGNYDECSFSHDGTGTFRGGENANPSIGKPFVRESVNEVRLEMIIESWKADSVIKAMIAAHPYEEVAYDRYLLHNLHPRFGMGSAGDWKEPKDMEESLRLIKKIFDIPVLRFNNVPKKDFRCVAVLGGAGMEYYSAAKSQGAEIFITGDIRYHDFYRAKHDGLLLVDAGHSETERFVTQGMLKAAKAACNVVNLHTEETQNILVPSGIRPSEVRYY